MTNSDITLTSEERTWAALSHLSILLNLFTGFLGIITAFVIYLVYRDRSRYVAYHSLQSLISQLLFWAVAGFLAGIIWGVTVPLLFLIVGFCLLPLALVITIVPIAALIAGVIGAIRTNNGEDFKYWLVGDWVRGTLTGD